jgi:TonB family protein
MIATWMFAATVFAALLGVAALAAERASRTLGRQARGPWIAALAAAVGWPAIAPALSSALAKLTRGTAHGPATLAQSLVTTVNSPAPAASRGWVAYADVALIALWALMSAVLLLRLARAMRALSRVERSADRDVIDGVPVLVTPSLGPAVFGTRRTHVVVPRWLFELDAPLRTLVVSHEQEHCRARDPQLTLIVAVALALVPWNAGVWWIARRLRLAMELDCDARVLQHAGHAERYSRLLLFIAQRQSLVRLAPMLAESNSHLSWRIAAMNSPRPRRPHLRTVAFAIVAAGTLGYSAKFASALTTAPVVSLPGLRDGARAATPAVTSAANQPVAPAAGAPAPRVEVPRRESPSPDAQRAGSPRAEVSMGAMKLKTPAAPQDSDRSVRAVPGSAAPRYPDILKTAGVEGAVLVSFVVDRTGDVDAGSIKILRSTHSLFAKAVTTALPQMHFLPAILHNEVVRQAVRLPITFSMMGSPLATAEGQRAVLEKLLADAPLDNFVTLSPVVITAVVP